MRMSVLAIVGGLMLVGLASSLGPVRAAQGTTMQIDRVNWLAGCWERRSDRYLNEEQWMVPRGGSMVGMSRTVAGGKTVAYEFVRIEERDGQLFYIADPSGQEKTEFSQAELTDSVVAFENPTHDFPQIIRYRRLPDGTILGQIEGVSKGEHRVVDFPLRPVTCDPSKQRN